MTAVKTQIFCNRGTSMSPTLQPGDFMIVSPCGPQRPRRGDVVLFRSSEREGIVVHRVIAVEPRGFITRGDNNRRADKPAFTPDTIIGLVVGVQRAGRTIPVIGGPAGFRRAIVLRYRRYGLAVVVRVLHKPLRWIAVHRIYRDLLVRWTRTVCIARPEGSEVQMLLGRRVIGTLRAGESAWRMRPWFGVFGAGRGRSE